jgi:hypothetical protein
MDTFSPFTSTSTALAITRIVDGRCSSLANPGTTIHPALIIFGRGPSNTKLFVLDNGLLNGSTQVLGGGAWSVRFDAPAGGHSFRVCTSSGAVSSPWDIIIEVPAPQLPPIDRKLKIVRFTGTNGDYFDGSDCG